MSVPDLSREQWLELRRQSIGASEAAAACGEDPNVSPLELVARKRGVIEEPDLGDLEFVRWGNLLESAIVEETARRESLRLLSRAEIEQRLKYDDRTELVGFVDGRQPFLRSRARPWQTATPDGLGVDAASEIHGLEVKNVSTWMARDWSEDQALSPAKFQCQALHQIAVVPALSSVVLAGLIGGNDLRRIRFERIQVVQVVDALVAIEESVWRCVETDALPELSGPPASVARALKALHPDDSGESVTLPDEIVPLVHDLERMKLERKGAEDIIEEMSNRVRAAMGSATFGLMPDGSGTFSLKTQERAEYVAKASKFRVLRFSKTKARARA